MCKFTALPYLAATGQITAIGRGGDTMKSATVLGLWWRAAAVLSAALVVDAKIAENRALAFLTAALCAALMVFAASTIAAMPKRG
jgi:hypothetical protein